MNIIVSGITYSFDNEGNTKSVAVSLTGSVAMDNLSAYVHLEQADLESEQTFDDLSKKQIVALAKKKLAAYTAVEAQ